MDHSMHHAGMDHGGHDHMDMGECKMNMLFTFSTDGLCIIFPQWRVTGPISLLLSLVAVALMTAGYEGVREISRRYEASQAQKRPFSGTSSSTAVGDDENPSPPPAVNNNLPTTPYQDEFVNGINNQSETSSLLGSSGRDRMRAERRGKTVTAALYAVQVFYSFFIMLLFMTYNGWVMLAVTVGAFIGYMAFGQSSATKSVACH
ncbi:hypothetical protein FQN54_003479 [Arachnomyces sp. PD_36]|nr:hypothetical protein FQN54_003479 [Arachnomyces sp. PD_36]